MPVCHIALGSNLGDPRRNLDKAIEALAALPDVNVRRVSTYYATTPAGGPAGQADFLNAAAEISTRLDPLPMLGRLQQVERQLGRRRRARWEARSLDLDVLLYEQHILHDAQLQLPHPRMHFRRFVLEPLCEIAPELRHPVMGWTVRELLENLLRRPLYVALAGPPACGKTTLARRTARATGAHLVCKPQPPAACDPSRHDPRLRVQYLVMCAGSLNRRRAEQSGWTISDYWLDQVCLAQQRQLPRWWFEQCGRTWEQARAEALSPTLLACLDGATKTLLERCRDRTDAGHFSAPLIDQERAELFDYIDQRQPAPLVRLDGEDLDAAQRELVAAMQAAAG